MHLKRTLGVVIIFLCAVGCSSMPAEPSPITVPSENIPFPAQTAPTPKDVSNYYVDDLDDDTEDQDAVDALYWYLYGNLAPKDYTAIALYKGQVALKAMEKAPVDALLQDYNGPWAPIYFCQTSFSRVDLMQAKNAIETLYQVHPGRQLRRLNIYEGESKVQVEVVSIDDELIEFVENYPIQDIFEVSKFVPEEDLNPD